MWNIVKSQNYQLRHDLFTMIACLIFVVITMCFTFSDLTLTGSEKLVSMNWNENSIFLALVCIIFCGRIGAWDFNDKTINYELLSGHARKDMIWGRLVCVIVWSFVFCLIMEIAPVVICTVVNGWGEYAKLADCVIRMWLSLLPIFRIICEFFLLAILVRNYATTYALAYVLLGASLLGVLLLGEVLNVDITYTIGQTMIGELLGISNGHSELIGGVDIMVYDVAMQWSVVAKVATSSILGGAVCLVIAYVLFQKRDMQ